MSAEASPSVYVNTRAPREPREQEIDFSPIGGIVPIAILAGIVYIGYTYKDKILEILKNLDSDIQKKIGDFPEIKLPSLSLGDDDSGPGTGPSSGSGTQTNTSLAGGQTDSNGIKLPFKMTGKSVKMNVGAKHPNGDRYNTNHAFQNYYSVGYYKTGSGGGKMLIEMKTDGPNHSGCTSLPKCEWVECDFNISTGESYISSEWPHPKNHPAITPDFAKKLSGTFTGGKWVGFGVAAYKVGQFRAYEIWIDPGGLKSNQWVKTLSHINRDKKLIPDPTRSLPTSGRGMEAEIRMNNQHGTSMQFGNVYEIVPPSTAAFARAYSYPAVVDEMRPLYAPRISMS